jgi:hypothetical protein
MDPFDVLIVISANEMDTVQIKNAGYGNIMINSFKIDNSNVLSSRLPLLSGESKTVISEDDVGCIAKKRSRYNVYINYTNEGMNDGYYFGTYEVNLTCAN